MSDLHVPHPLRDHPEVGDTAREAFWIVALGVIACYAFFFLLGGISPSDVLPATITVGLLAVLWIAHGAAQRRMGGKDPRLMHERERRGF